MRKIWLTILFVAISSGRFLTHSTSLHAGPVTLYAQLASILRSQILSGTWAAGQEIPTLEELAAEYAVARVTVRQAVQMLAAEGLISSKRGRRTIVTYEPSNHPVLWSIGAAEKETPNFSITILAKEEIDSAQVPQRDIFFGQLSGKYIYIRKLDNEAGEPYALSSNFVASQLFRRFPEGAETRVKLTRLIKDHAGVIAATWKERVTIGAADYIEAGFLKCPLSAPVARVARICTDQSGRIVCLGLFVYIGTRYMTERDITSLM